MDYAVMGVALAKLFVFSIFITAIIEVIKAIAARGAWNLIWELFSSLWSNSPLSSESVKILNFLIALLYCKVFDYGVMTNILQLQFKENPFAYFLDYIGTASLVFMGAGWVFDQIATVRSKYSVIPEKGPAQQ